MDIFMIEMEISAVKRAKEVRKFGRFNHGDFRVVY